MSTRITVPEIAADLDLSMDSVYELLKAGEIPSIKLNRMWIVSRAAYERWKLSIGEKAA